MARRALASTPGTCRVPFCQIIVLAEAQGKESGGGSVPCATALRFSSFAPAIASETHAEEPKL